MILWMLACIVAATGAQEWATGAANRAARRSRAPINQPDQCLETEEGVDVSDERREQPGASSQRPSSSAAVRSDRARGCVEGGYGPRRPGEIAHEIIGRDHQSAEITRESR